MYEFENYLGYKVMLAEGSWEHIQDKHPEVLINPECVLMSKINPECELYFLKKTGPKSRYTLVVVKYRRDGYWISTAMTKSKVGGGAFIYKRDSKC